ncbi:actin 4 [Pelomyxa schiedti]|nr:actin 4 [Pelomyxa schiedti]
MGNSNTSSPGEIVSPQPEDHEHNDGPDDDMLRPTRGGRPDFTTVVVDNGTHTIKAGFAGHNSPRGMFRPIIMGASSSGDLRVGDEVPVKCTSARCPMENGVVTNWEDMAVVWEHMYNKELRVSPSDHPLLMGEPALNPPKNREKMVELVFEKLHVQEFYAANAQLLALFDSGRKTGIVVDCGFQSSRAVPCFEGSYLPHTVGRLDIGGKHISQLMERALSVTPEIASDVVNQTGYVALNFEEESAKAAEDQSLYKTYELPDGQVITVKRDRFHCPEALFQPCLADAPATYEKCGIHTTCFNAIMMCDPSIRLELYNSIVLSGGASMLSGLADRLTAGVASYAPTAARVKVVAPPERKYAVWIGGCIIGSMSTFSQMWISHSEYEEKGASLVHYKCY